MIWKTRFTDMTQTKYPLIMGAFAGMGKAEFAAPFSEAGGLGIITAMNFKTISSFRKELQKMNDLTDKPFGINISVLPPQVKGGQDMRHTREGYLEYVEEALSAGVKIFTTSAYKAKFIGDRVHDAGGFWFHKAATLKHAQSAQEAGCDAVTIVGLEGAGFKNPLTQTTLVNVTLGRKLLDIPIIAAGGIGDARGFLGALAMGADAVCFGTALMVCKECPVSEGLKQKWLKKDILSKKYHKKIYHLQLRDSTQPSMAVGHRDQILSMDDFVSEIINQSENILRSWGFNSEIINFLKKSPS
ncbi:MAG: NAD(P)H-dependent flavin oxidoreductase [Promethearchaeia archaeon]